MKFLVIDFDLRIKPSKNEGKVLIIYKTEFMTAEHTIECEESALENVLSTIFSNFKGSALGEVHKAYIEERNKPKVIAKASKTLVKE